MAMRRAVGTAIRRNDLAEGLGYAVKRRLLGPPLVNEQLSEQRLSKRLALGVLSPDGISSSAYGTEEILIELLKGGLGADRVHPDPADDRRGLVRHDPGGSVLPRGGHGLHQGRRILRGGPGQLRARVAQVAAVALLIDYVVTVAVQVAAGHRGGRLGDPPP